MPRNNAPCFKANFTNKPPATKNIGANRALLPKIRYICIAYLDPCDMMPFRNVALLLLLCAVSAAAPCRDFTVVIDAGHGGHDPGATGRVAKEKDINLRVALQLGQKIQDRCKDVEVIYTRKADTFIPLGRRADIANRAKADLFISIHANAVAKGSTVRGAETYTLGLARSEANLEVAKRENAVILIEDDYRQRYAGFNPNSSESYIMFEFIQDKHMEESVDFAKAIQGQFRDYAGRRDRGVHQAGFLVLRETTMPSVLIELGYISTPEEERFLHSKAGSEKLAESICRAFLEYKEKHAGRLAAADAGEEKGGSPRAAAGGIRFKVQVLASARPLKEGAKELKGLSPVECYKEGGYYKYTYGESGDYDEILEIKKKVSAQFKDAFIVAFRDGRKMDVRQAAAEAKKKNQK